jgi:hypothetical protein
MNRYGDFIAASTKDDAVLDVAGAIIFGPLVIGGLLFVVGLFVGLAREEWRHARRGNRDAP